MDKISIDIRSRNMARIKAKNTKPELTVRKLLTSKNYRYRIHYQLHGKPDIVFPKYKIAVFVHGCYWHGHGCKVDHVAKSNTDFWSSKIIRNKERDKQNKDSLIKEGWKVLTIWECDIRKNCESACAELLKFLAVKTMRETNRGAMVR